MSNVPAVRVRAGNQTQLAENGDYVLYWMTAFRRSTYNFALERAIEWAVALHKPLLILEALRCDYTWASDRLHWFVLQGMADNQRYLSKKCVAYYPYVEPHRGAGRGLLQRLSQHASLVVTDDFPAFFLPRMVEAAGRQLSVRLELIDSNGLLPLRAADRAFSRAFDFRRFLQKSLLPHLAECPQRDPLSGIKLPQLDTLPAAITHEWPPADPAQLLASPAKLNALPVDHSVRPVEIDGGSRAAEKVLRQFIESRLNGYAEERNQPDVDASSRLSPYLHFGHISAHQVFQQVAHHASWTPGNTAKKSTGSATGWWGSSVDVESFFDELITWRELGYNMCAHRDDYDRYDSLPNWARHTLEVHAGDARTHVYSLDEFEVAKTHDSLWNAAQRQLLVEGRIHNYLRMLWGKKILEWSASPRDALRIMIELNNKYALDGRDPNSYSGICWVLGRYDRAWGPERPVFGKVRYMSSENTARKVRVKKYLAKYATLGDI